MGCSSSKPTAAHDVRAGLPGSPQEQRPLSIKGERSHSLAERSLPANDGFAGFLSHYKIEAATEARWLQQQLEEELNERCFLDSDDLVDLSKLKNHVRESKCVVLLQTASVLTRPWCLLERGGPAIEPWGPWTCPTAAL